MEAQLSDVIRTAVDSVDLPDELPADLAAEDPETIKALMAQIFAQEQRRLSGK